MDYKREELATILDLKVKSQNLVFGDEARQAALAFLDYRKRITKNFGNGGEIDIALGHAQKSQTLRIGDLPADQVSKRMLMELLPEDFAVPAPITKDDFWKAMDAMSGWDDIKAELKSMAQSIEGAVKRGKAPTDAVEPYWIVEGPPGTGKSTLAKMLAMFGAAYGLTALPEVVDVQGANFQGEFVGQTAGVVQKQFEKAWGRLMFVDEVSGLAKSGGDFKFEAAKIILAQTENHRGKFMMVVADYAQNINQFLALDPGLARRFGKRITLKPWTAEQATDDLRKKLSAEGFIVVGLDALMKKHFAELAKEPGYASGGDVRTLKNDVISFIDAHAAQDPAAILADAIKHAFASLIDKKKKDAGPSAQNPYSGAPVAAAVAVAMKTEEGAIETGLDGNDNRVLAALDATNQKLAAQMDGLDLAELERLASDPKSFFAKELAKALGVKAEVALKQLAKVRVKVKKLVAKQELVERFVYHCPFCQRIESAACAYINYPMDWKMANSLKKPWTEVKTTQQEIEVVEERTVKSGD
jgi:SpoVK/Ycf46/Vps4 family AAA+-type ATPase